MNVKEGFDVYDELPEDMIAYLRYNGRHFNRRLVEFATSKMTTRDSNGTEVPLEPISKDKLFDIMKLIIMTILTMQYLQPICVKLIILEVVLLMKNIYVCMLKMLLMM